MEIQNTLPEDVYYIVFSILFVSYEFVLSTKKYEPMSRKNTSLSTKKMVSGSKRHGACSTPEHSNSPSRDSDSFCESESSSPVPFLCTQDGIYGETDVVWNFYTPKANHSPGSRSKNSTPLSRKSKKFLTQPLKDKPLPKKKIVRQSQKKSEIFQDLIELNQNIHKFIAKKPSVESKRQSGSEEDIFNDSPERSPKSGLRSSTCLRKNLLSSKFNKPETDNVLESDDSMNECLLRASQIVEENIIYHPETKPCYQKPLEENMDSLLGNITFESPVSKAVKKQTSPCIKNDSFDNCFGELNDSALQRLSQMPVNNKTPVIEKKSGGWVLKELVVHESPSNNLFGRHSSMPESPSVSNQTKPSTSGSVFGRYNSMPYKENKTSDISPIRCTQDEIRRKHQHAREKLLAKRLLPFTQSTQEVDSSIPKPVEVIVPKRPHFQLRKPTMSTEQIKQIKANEIKLQIEKKRQEALMKLRKKHMQKKG